MLCWKLGFVLHDHNTATGTARDHDTPDLQSLITTADPVSMETLRWAMVSGISGEAGPEECSSGKTRFYRSVVAKTLKFK